MQIEMARIETPNDNRNHMDVTDLVTSIQMIGGLINPVLLKKMPNAKYKVVAGRRRFKAYQELKLSSIPAIVTEAEGLREELCKIDENLVRLNLNTVEFEQALVRRKQIYLELHPHTAQHVAGGNASQGAEHNTLSFVKDVANKLGVSPRSIERAVARTNLCEAVKNARISGDINTTKADILLTLDVRAQEKLLPFATNQKASVLQTIVDKIKSGDMQLDAIELPKYPTLSSDLHRVASKLASLLITAEKNGLVIEDVQALKQLRAIPKLVRKVLPGKLSVASDTEATQVA